MWPCGPFSAPAFRIARLRKRRDAFECSSALEHSVANASRIGCAGECALERSSANPRSRHIVFEPGS
eukprot:9876550-Alexandrium_andersonii.AAC.1